MPFTVFDELRVTYAFAPRCFLDFSYTPILNLRTSKSKIRCPYTTSSDR